MISYILFEIVVAFFHFLFNLPKKNKKPLFFFETLLKRTENKESVVRIVMHYNILSTVLIAVLVYLRVPIQTTALMIFLYFKLYINVINPAAAYTGMLDLFKETKKTAIVGFSETSRAVSDIKKIYDQRKKDKEEAEK